MAALSYLCLVRGLAELVLGRAGGSPLTRALQWVTAPAVVPVRSITPLAVAGGVAFFAVIWLTALRIVWYQVCTVAGMRLSLGAF